VRDVAENRTLGDTTTLADPAVVEEIKHRADAEPADEERAPQSRHVPADDLAVTLDPLRAFAEATTDAFFVKDREGRYAYANPAWLSGFGLTLEGVLGRTDLDLFSPEVAVPRMERDRLVLERGETVVNEAVQTTLEGAHWYISRKDPWRGESGEIIGVVGNARDITERREAEEERDRVRAEMDLVFAGAPVGLAFLDQGARYVRLNSWLARFIGIAPEELLGRTPAELVPGAEPSVEAIVRGVLETGEPAIDIERSGELLGRPGELLHWVSSYYPLRDAAGDVVGVGLVVRDVTEQRHLEERARSRQRLEALGGLAGGIAHDFNNLLTAITGYAEIALSGLGPEEPVRTDIEEIRHAAGRAAALTSQLLAFGRSQVLRPETVDLNDVVLAVDPLLRRLLGADVELVTLLGEGLAPVSADRGQLEQVLVNLAVNARDAMPAGGTLAIATTDVTLPDGELPPGDYVRLSVADTGIGIPSGLRDRIFEPFFTTKEAGEGSGLGLATVYGIVSQSSGAIGVESKPGRTVFTVHLPRAEGAAMPSATAAPDPLALGGNETILLVDDEDVVRGLVRRVLAERGYTVLEARNGSEALSVAERANGSIDLVVTDVVMPHLGGPEMVERLVQVRPDLKVLFISGYTGQATSFYGVQPGRAFLQKPFTPQALAEAVRSALDGV